MAYKHTYPVVDPAPRKQTHPIVDQAAHKQIYPIVDRAPHGHIYPVVGRALSDFLVFLLLLLVALTITGAILTVFGGTGAIDVQTTDYPLIIGTLLMAASS